MINVAIFCLYFEGVTCFSSYYFQIVIVSLQFKTGSADCSYSLWVFEVQFIKHISSSTHVLSDVNILNV